MVLIRNSCHALMRQTLGEDHRGLATLRVEMLDRFCITYKGNTVTTVNTARLQSLLAYLVVPGESILSRFQ